MVANRLEVEVGETLVKQYKILDKRNELKKYIVPHGLHSF